jgi:glycosyltransferase involved in cell wall biosynthesis
LKKIKVLFTIPNFDTAGSGKALLNIALGLDKNEFEAEILCKHDKGEFFKVVENSGLKIHIFEYESQMRPILKGIYSCWKVSRKLKQIKPDVIHSFHYSSDYSEALAAKFAGIKWIFTKKNMNWGGNSKNSWRLRTFLAKHIIAQNTDMMKEFFPSRKNVTLIPRGVNTEYFVPQEYDLRENIIVCTANLVPLKGIEILIESFLNVHKIHSDWKLKIIGSTSSEYGQNLLKKYQNWIEMGLILFTGKLVDIRPELRTGKIFVLPTKTIGEGSPVSLLEAMSCGLIPLGSNVAGIKDVLKDFPELLFDVTNDSKAIVNKLIYILSSYIHSDIFSLEFTKYIRIQYDIKIEIEKHSLLYKINCDQ